MQHELVCSYSRTLAGWLTKRFPGAVSLDSSGAVNEEIINVLQLLLPAIEFQATTQGHYDLSGRIKQLSGLKTKKEQLVWLLELFSRSKLPEPVKDELYGQLKVFVKWSPEPLHIASIYQHLPVARPGARQKLIRPIQASRITRKKINAPIILPAEEKNFLLDAMKTSLALNYRETDPVTFADAAGTELFDMGRGLQIAVVGMQKQKRLSLESYIGYMAFTNGVPIAYGGGWIWGQRCRIGISIYPDFRKGESAWIFGQVLRLYYQYFNARHFIIRANQFGEGNSDGLKSGAFWFYYKMGFRPCDDGLRKLAGAEWKRIRGDKNYRSSLKTLRRFLGAPLEWKQGNASFPAADADTISRKVSDSINTGHGGSRVKALRSVKMQLREKIKPLSWPMQQGTGINNFENWGLLVNLFNDLPDWNREDKKRLIELIRVKQEGNERDHITGMQTFPAFWRSVQRL